MRIYVYTYVYTSVSVDSGWRCGEQRVARGTRCCYLGSSDWRVGSGDLWRRSVVPTGAGNIALHFMMQLHAE